MDGLLVQRKPDVEAASRIPVSGGGYGEEEGNANDRTEGSHVETPLGAWASFITHLDTDYAGLVGSDRRRIERRAALRSPSHDGADYRACFEGGCASAIHRRAGWPISRLRASLDNPKVYEAGTPGVRVRPTARRHDVPAINEHYRRRSPARRTARQLAAINSR
jgi:hypothetical protein